MLAYTWKLFLRTSARSFLQNGVFSYLQTGARNALVVFGLACSSSFLATTPLFAQTEVSSGYKISDDMKAKLLKKGLFTPPHG